MHTLTAGNYSYVEKRLIYSVVLREFTRHISVVDDCGRSTNPKNCLYLCINLLYEFGATFLFRFSVIPRLPSATFRYLTLPVAAMLHGFDESSSSRC